MAHITVTPTHLHLPENMGGRQLARWRRRNNNDYLAAKAAALTGLISRVEVDLVALDVRDDNEHIDINR
jgi:predicted alpha/beta hydrolase